MQKGRSRLPPVSPPMECQAGSQAIQNLSPKRPACNSSRRAFTHSVLPFYHFLAEVEAGADLRDHLEEYAALPADFIRVNGGAEFMPVAFLVRGANQ